MRRHKMGPTTAMLAIAVVLAACGSGDTADGTPAARATTGAPTTTTQRPTTSVPAVVASTPTTEPTGSDALFPEGLRGVRYCEVLLLKRPGAEFEAEVWNTIGLNDCPASAWEALDPAAIATDHGALLALLNGPRAWTLDAIVSETRSGAPTTVFGDIEMFRAATVALGPELPRQTPYTERPVARETVFSFRAGSEVYELGSPTGQTYVMQSYSQQVDPSLTLDALASLGARLALPEGWTYSTRVLEADLDLLSMNGVATVVQDELQNTYQRVDRIAG